MAQMETNEFKFPDEIPESQDTEISDEIEIEIEDDTPEADRGKVPIPKEERDALLADELEDYSTKVRNKLLKLKRTAHDERREKEEAERQVNVAVTASQRVLAENARLKAQLAERDKDFIDSVKQSVEMEMDKAKKEYVEAYESGDAQKVLAAQEKLNSATLRADKVKSFKPAPLQEDEPAVQPQQQAPQRPARDPTAVAWQERNAWFGPNKLMTSMALAMHEQLKEEGVAVSSQEYYRRIDETMRQRFPEKFESDTPPNGSARTRTSSVVAAATRSTAPKRIRLTQSEMAIAKKFGLTPEQYAREVIKLEAKNG